MVSIAHQMVTHVESVLDSPEFESQVLEPVTIHIKEAAVESTRKGQQMTGEGYTPYSESTQARKGYSAPDFRETGEAMASIMHSVGDGKGKITFSDKADVLYMHQKGTNRDTITPDGRHIFPEQGEQQTGEMVAINKFAERKLTELLNE